MHQHSLRVYYEDTDLAGIVYYANYLKFIERGRSELLRARGIDQAALQRDTGVVFAVRHLEIDYHAPARFDDLLTVTTRIELLRGARIGLDQQVLRDHTVLVAARVTIVAVGRDGRAVRIPPAIRAALA